MNPATIKMALSAASAMRSRVKDYREEKSREAYDRLSDAAATIDLDDLRQRSATLLDESRREAGVVTQAARARLEKALEELESRRDETREKTGKSLDKAKKNLPSTRRAAAARRRKGLTVVGAIALLLSAIGGAYYWFTRRPQPDDTPPRVQDFSGAATGAATGDAATETTTESTLVYSTSTPVDGSEGAAGPLAEDPAERDEELLGSLDEQLQKHRSAAMDEAGVDDEPLSKTPSVDELSDPDAAPVLTEDADELTDGKGDKA